MSTNQNPSVALILLTSLILLLCVTTCQASEPAPKDAKTYSSIGQQDQQVAQDTITITIAEVGYAKAFLDSILKLRSLDDFNGEPGEQVLQCVGGVTVAMNNIVGELKKVEDSWPSLYWGTTRRSLENVVDEVLSYNVICERALENVVDGTIKLMVLRKLEEVVMLTNDVITRVAKLQLGSKKP